MNLTLDDVFSPGGVLSETFENYEHRPQQLEMARCVEHALKKRKPVVVEAATGTGKTLAYLVPALLSKKRVVVSTGTKALQEQLFFKDIPLLQKILPEPFEAVLLKGRKNYLCHHRFHEMQRQPAFRSREDALFWPKIQQWALSTQSGDRAEIVGLPDHYPSWNDLSVGSEGCLGAKCAYFQQCYVQMHRERAQEADLIVVNHHLFFADLALREIGFGEILPEYDAVIFDEAHHLEDIATEYFGVQVSNYRFVELAGDIERVMEEEEVVDDGDIDALLTELWRDSAEFFTQLGTGLTEGRHALEQVLGERDKSQIDAGLTRLYDSLDELAKKLWIHGSLGEVGERLSTRCKLIRKELEKLFSADDRRYAYLLETRDRGVFVRAAPIDVAELFRTKLLDTHDALVFTSATLSTNGRLDYFKRRLGMTEFEAAKRSYPAFEIDEAVLPSVYNYREQCLLYIPSRLPGPEHQNYQEYVAQIVEYLIKITEGRAFVLFTSYYNMNGVYDLLAGKLPYHVLKQGDRPKSELLSEFRTQEQSVLFATSSFWEGVDVEGEALSLVIIDKLPFANPSDPLLKARLDLLESQGRNAFMDMSVPAAALTLKQGFGRLIRSQTDRGIVAILDSRLAHRRYGKYFLNTLPDASIVWTAPEAKRWWHGSRMIAKNT